MLHKYNGFTPLLCCRRYIDDGVGASSCTRKTPREVDHVSNFHPALQCTHTFSEEKYLPIQDITGLPIPVTAETAFPSASSIELDVCEVPTKGA